MKPRNSFFLYYRNDITIPLAVIDTWAEDRELRHKRWMAKYRDAIEQWNIRYDGTLARLHADLDDPLDTETDIELAEIQKLSCQKPLSGQPEIANRGHRKITFVDWKTAHVFSLLASIN